MAPLVVDASVALAQVWPDEISGYADAVLAFLRNRLTSSDQEIFLTALSRLSIHVDEIEPLTVIRDGTAAATRFGLTAYDAAYVELAAREGLPLATLDKRMLEAASKAGVVLFAP